MGDDELAAIRAKRLAELQAQGGGGGGGAPGGGDQAAQRAAMESQRNMMLSALLDQGARARLNTIAAVKPDKARAVEDMLIGMARGGQIRGKVNEDQLRDLLGQVSAKMDQKVSVTFNRRRVDSSSDGSDTD